MSGSYELAEWFASTTHLVAWVAAGVAVMAGIVAIGQCALGMARASFAMLVVWVIAVFATVVGFAAGVWAPLLVAVIAGGVAFAIGAALHEGLFGRIRAGVRSRERVAAS
ncbi:hypothetical protein ACFQZV_00875 [Microbacterium koreense]|uniref:DUF2516 family protein n=1 Tax=Microbacterium koreense TaxID=323761 RepID=A0ABW2ZMQ6_9MICO